jgi:hypothetical protein
MINSTLVKKLEPEYVLDVFGIKTSYNSNLQIHSVYDCPAVIYMSGTMVWYKDGKRHRDNDLPAIVWSGGSKEWWVNGERIRREYT